MKLSRLFTKTAKTSREYESVNATLLEKGGFIYKEMAGVYDYLPLGLRVLEKINAIIRDEMNKTGAEELYLSVLQEKSTWTKTGRWDSAKDIMYQFQDASKKDVGLGWTHEEPITAIAQRFINSYKDLPKAIYQIQTKFRNEPRAKSGLLRGREFLMKDLYSFHASEADLDQYYERMAEAYKNVFERAGVIARRTLASGGLFSQFSDEFQVLTDVGEDMILYCEKCLYAANQEIAAHVDLKNGCPKCGGKIKTGKSVEVGNIFKLGTRFSEAFGLYFTNESGEKKPVIMASYGIGPGRLLGTIVEVSHDNKGIIWPEAVAPYKVHLVELKTSAKGGSASGGKNLKLKTFVDKLYDDLTKAGVEVLYDDREVSAGEKFADADLLGIPYRAVVSEKTGERVELKKRNNSQTSILTVKEFLSLVS